MITFSCTYVPMRMGMYLYLYVFMKNNSEISIIFIIYIEIVWIDFECIKCISFCFHFIVVFIVTKSLNARFARCIVGQFNFTCPFQIDQSQLLGVTISIPPLFCIGIKY